MISDDVWMIKAHDMASLTNAQRKLIKSIETYYKRSQEGSYHEYMRQCPDEHQFDWELPEYKQDCYAAYIYAYGDDPLKPLYQKRCWHEMSEHVYEAFETAVLNQGSVVMIGAYNNYYKDEEERKNEDYYDPECTITPIVWSYEYLKKIDFGIFHGQVTRATVSIQGGT